MLTWLKQRGEMKKIQKSEIEKGNVVLLFFANRTSTELIKKKEEKKKKAKQTNV